MDLKDAAKAALAKKAANEKVEEAQEENFDDDEDLDTLALISDHLGSLAESLARIERHQFAANYIALHRLGLQAFDEGVYQAIYDPSIKVEDLYPHLKPEEKAKEPDAQS